MAKPKTYGNTFAFQTDDKTAEILRATAHAMGENVSTAIRTVVATWVDANSAWLNAAMTGYRADMKKKEAAAKRAAKKAEAANATADNA